MLKNVAGQYVLLVARNADGTAASGDAGNISAVVAKDGGAAAASANSVAEVTGLPGHYWLELSAGESNGDEIIVAAESSTSGVLVESIFASTSIGAEVSTSSTAAIADAVLDEALSAHTTAGTLGRAISDTDTNASNAATQATTAATQATTAATQATSAATDAATAAASAGTVGTASALDIATKVWQVDISAATPGGASSQSFLHDARDAAEANTTAIGALNDLDAAAVTAAVDASTAATDAGNAATSAGAAASSSSTAAAQSAAAVAAIAALNDLDAAAVTTAVDASTAATDASTAATQATAAVAAVAALEDLSAADVTGAVPTAAAIADAVWDEPIAGHASAGSTGATLASAASDALGAVDAVSSLNDVTAGEVATAVAASAVGTNAATAATQASAAVAAVAALEDLSAADVTGAVPTAAAISTAVWGQVIEGTLDAVDAHRIMLAALAGKLSGASSSSVAIRDTTDTTTRIAATVDSAGNRLAVTLDPS